MISLVVAASANDVIGDSGALPWHLTDDLKRFKALTLGKPVVMGRKTFEAIGRALPGRRNLVVTRQAEFTAPGCEAVSSPAAALEACAGDDEIMIIGGGEIYRQFLPLADRIYLTRVAARIDGDTTFPALDEASWEETSREEFPAGDGNDFSFAILTFERRR